MKFWHLLKETSLSVFDNLFYFLSFFVPKDKNLWVFGSMFGAGYADNSKYFFEYIIKEHPEVRAVWFSGKADVVCALRLKGFEAYRFYDPKGIWVAMRAGVAFISHSAVRDIRPFVFTSASIFVNLWHGIPLKRIALDDNVSEVRNKPFFQLFKWLAQVLCPGFRRQADLFTAASIEDQRNFASAFAFPIDKLKITGYPRNDVLLKPQSSQPGDTVVEGGVKKGIYVPTFRSKENTSFDFFDQFGFCVEEVDRSLGELRVKLYLKLHHFNIPSAEIKNSILGAENIFFYEKLDIYEELSDFDFLITDFSSIYFDFLLLERPIIFAPFDMSGFEDGVRQLYYDYAEVTPGPKAYSWPEVIKCIEEVMQKPDTYSAQVQQTKNRFHAFVDDRSSARVYREVISLLK